MKHILTVNGVDFEVRYHGVREQESYWTVQAEETVPSLVAGQASTIHTYPIAISRGFLVFDMAHPHSVWHDEKKIPLSAFGFHSRIPAMKILQLFETILKILDFTNRSCREALIVSFQDPAWLAELKEQLTLISNPTAQLYTIPHNEKSYFITSLGDTICLKEEQSDGTNETIFALGDEYLDIVDVVSDGRVVNRLVTRYFFTRQTAGFRSLDNIKAAFKELLALTSENQRSRLSGETVNIILNQFSLTR